MLHSFIQSHTKVLAALGMVLVVGIVTAFGAPRRRLVPSLNLVSAQPSAAMPASNGPTTSDGMLRTYHDTFLQFSLSYPLGWTIDTTQQSCCITISTSSSRIDIYDLTDDARVHNIHTVNQMADSLRLTNRHVVSFGITAGILGDEPVPNLGGLVDLKREYILLNSTGRAIEVDVENCSASVQTVCDQIARSLRFEVP